MMMSLAQIVPTLPVFTQTQDYWSVVGPEQQEFEFKLHVAGVAVEQITPVGQAANNRLLAGALSAREDAAAWLKQLAESLLGQAELLVVDWQADGPLEVGPELARRLKRGHVCRILREAGYTEVTVLQNQPLYYLIRAVKQAAAPATDPAEFVTVATLAELPKNGMKLVQVFGQAMIVANTGREIVAFARLCPHAGSGLEQGKLKGRHIFCPAHFYMWNVCTGEPVEPADEDILPTFPVKVDEANGLVQVALEPIRKM
jgi:3-phenylpropionate/trans-cinnamate dioxygenase ferredoxin subunit